MPTKNEILIYNLPDGTSNVEVYLTEDDLWMNQASLAKLFQSSTQNITMHIRHIYEEGELSETLTCKSNLQVQNEGGRTVKRTIKLYNLKMIIAIGFRVKSSTATAFRVWANNIITEYMIKGYSMDDKRLEDPEKFGRDYFDELYLRIRAIRASEKRFYQKVLDIYSTSIDYNKNDEQSIEFFKTVQNKLHYAISGETAAELIYHRADATKDNMGLTSWRGEHVQKADVTIAKNYLSKEEIDSLNQIVNMYLDHAERMAKSNIPMHMNDWIEALDAFLKFERADILIGAGKISHALAEQKAHKEYEKYDTNRQITMSADLDKELLDVLNKKK
ncbi:MAG: hydroxyacid dehydrogenase [Erysipelotrichaceae bacterium]|nr:hydroxyacid dehydrogenase [Erysipelotrichaceae bacterium]